MTARRPLTVQSGVVKEIIDTDGLQYGMEQNMSKSVDATAALTAKTLTTRRTYLTGTNASSLAITLPAASAAIDGQIMMIMATINRASTTWTSSGGVTTGLPNSLVANSPVSVIYHHALTRWFLAS